MGAASASSRLRCAAGRPRSPSGSIARCGSMPRSSSRSSASRIMVAPSRIMSRGVSASGSVTDPGTAKTSSPSSRPCSAVIRVPLRDAPCTTTIPRDSAAISRLRAGNRNGSAGTPGGYSPTMRAALLDGAEQPAVARRIVDVDPRAEHGDRGPSGVERTPMRRRVDADRAAAHDHHARDREPAREVGRDLPAGRRRPTRADERDTIVTVRERPPPHEDPHRRIGESQEGRPVLRVAGGREPCARGADPIPDRARIGVGEEGPVVVRSRRAPEDGRAGGGRAADTPDQREQVARRDAQQAPEHQDRVGFARTLAEAVGEPVWRRRAAIRHEPARRPARRPSGTTGPPRRVRPPRRPPLPDPRRSGRP